MKIKGRAVQGLPDWDPVANRNANSVMKCGSRSDTGRVRDNNEDSFRAEPEMNLFVLSDGMGGLASGEVASRLTVETVVAHCRDAETNPHLPLIGKPIEGVTPVSNRLVSAIRLANRVVHRVAQKNAAYRGMGATVVAIRSVDNRVSLAHVGDSRAYLLREDHFEQLTSDHSFIAEQTRQGRIVDDAVSGTMQSVLTRAVGAEPEVEVDISEELLMDTDTVLLCSDGLTRELPDAQIADVLRATSDAQEGANRLVTLANQKGGGDNITAVVLRPAVVAVGVFSHIARLGRWFTDHGDTREQFNRSR